MLCRRHKSKTRRSDFPGRSASAGQSAFTVTELMVAVSLMSLIVLALYAMFNQTQRALRANEAQVDSTERGRSMLELLSREIESARVGMRPGVTNMWIAMAAGTRKLQGDLTANVSATYPRTNEFDNLFYLAKSGKSWRGVGYAVLERTNVNGVEMVQGVSGGMGALFRYETQPLDYDYGHPGTNLFQQYLKLNPSISNLPTDVTNYSQMADGIVHFKLTPYDTRGRILSFAAIGKNITDWFDPNYLIMRADKAGQMIYGSSTPELGTNSTFATVVLQEDPNFRDVSKVTFRSNALPAYVELELGVLEPDTMRQYNQMVKDGLYPQAAQYLGQRIAKVQIFRKRIPLRTVAQ